MKIRKPVAAILVDWNGLQTPFSDDKQLVERIETFEQQVDDMKIHIADLRLSRHLLRIAQDAIKKENLK